MDREKKVIEDLFERGILANPDILNQDLDESLLTKVQVEQDIVVLNSDYAEVIQQKGSLVDWYEIDRYRVDAEKHRDEELYQNELNAIKKANLTLSAFSVPSVSPTTTQISGLEAELSSSGAALGHETSSSRGDDSEVFSGNHPFSLALAEELAKNLPAITVISYETIARKYEPSDFANLFVFRFHFLENLLRGRQELANNTTISRILSKKEKENVSVIGIVSDLGTTKNGNIILTLEDPTGKIKVLISRSRKETFAAGSDVVFDEVIGITGMYTEGILFADTIVWPDLPLNRDMKKSEQEEYAVFLSDIHYGSSLFLKNEFEKFLRWINGKAGNETQQQIASKVKYIFIVGDLVDGVGVYPDQELELEIKDIRLQYEGFANLLRKIPADKHIIMCPGNHDVVHLAEPQAVFYKEFAESLFQLPHVTLTTNPSFITIGTTPSFPGFDVLLYHGYSFDYYVANVDSIRNNGGYHRADLIMKFLLKRRHLAPSFKSTPYFPSLNDDPLLIKKIPDFFATGHIHYCNVANYKGVTMISGSCWQDKTTFQEKLGHEPEPARVPLVNLKTREVKVLKFM